MKPGEHKTVQARILEYAEAIGWTFVRAPGRSFKIQFELGISHTAPAKKFEMGLAGIGFSVASGESITRNAN
ncbi:hypothetical protein [Desulfosarcina sp.]|uniref:hypothetical protein n=1 Tax=Desulfosarcina sp. TaxID=2027861 RepID=UPI0039708688